MSRAARPRQRLLLLLLKVGPMDAMVRLFSMTDGARFHFIRQWSLQRQLFRMTPPGGGHVPDVIFHFSDRKGFPGGVFAIFRFPLFFFFLCLFKNSSNLDSQTFFFLSSSSFCAFPHPPSHSGNWDTLLIGTATKTPPSLNSQQCKESRSRWGRIFRYQTKTSFKK